MRLKLIATSGIRSAFVLNIGAAVSTLTDTPFVDGYN